jgi:hypothetical protein
MSVTFWAMARILSTCEQGRGGVVAELSSNRLNFLRDRGRRAVFVPPASRGSGSEPTPGQHHGPGRHARRRLLRSVKRRRDSCGRRPAPSDRENRSCSA